MNHYIQSIRSTFIILMIVGLGFMQSARAAVDSIGVISVVIGEAEIVRANGQSEAKSGAELFRNDLVKTGKASRVQVLLKDQTAVNLGQNAEIRLDEFVYSGAEPKVSLNVAKGTFRFISGKIADQKPDNVKVKTPLAIIGVRGTEYIGQVGTDLPGADAASTASKTDVTLLSGIIVVENDLGQQVISKPGFGVTIEPTGAISEPARVSEKELDSKLQAVSTNEEDVKQEEESSDSEPSTEQSPAPAAEEDEPSGTSASSTEEEGAKTEDAPAAESQETSTQESSAQESSSADNTSSSESAAEVAPVESTTESTDNESSAPEPASPSVTMNTEEGDSATTTNSTNSTSSATTTTSRSSSNTSVTAVSTTSAPASTSVNAASTSSAEPYTAANGGLSTTTNDPAMSNVPMTATQTSSSDPFTASSMGTNTSSQDPFAASSTAGTPATYDSSSILVGSNDDYSFAGGSDAPLQTSVYAPAATSDSTGYATAANEPAPFTAAETATSASQTSTADYLTADTYDYSSAVATDDTFALATQVTADNTLQTTEDAAVASSNALPSIYGFSSGMDMNDPARTTIYENNTYAGLISATDADVSDPDNLIYNIESGGDGDLFVLNNVRELVFRLPPDYEVTEDQDVDRIYEVNISVTDGMDDDLKTLYVTVENNPIIDSSSSLNPFEGGITSTEESLIDELTSWSDFFVLAGTGTFDFQSIRFVDQCTITNFCMSDVVFSASYNASSQLVDVSIQGEFSSSYGGVDGIFSATWDNHPISSFSGSSSSNFNDPNASAPPGTATFVSDINRLQAVFGTTSGVVGLDSDDSASITLTPAAAPNNTEYLVASQFQLAEDLRANTSYPYSAVGRVGVLELQKDQYGAVINDDFVDSSSFLGQSVPAATTPANNNSAGASQW